MTTSATCAAPLPVAAAWLTGRQQTCTRVQDLPVGNGASLQWCANTVSYYRCALLSERQGSLLTSRSFCDVTLQGDVASLEQAAQAAYNALLFGLGTAPTVACRLKLHDWVCWQFLDRKSVV